MFLRALHSVFVSACPSPFSSEGGRLVGIVRLNKSYVWALQGRFWRQNSISVWHFCQAQQGLGVWEHADPTARRGEGGCLCLESLIFWAVESDMEE